MRKVTAFVGSARKMATYNATVQFLANLEALDEVECEIVVLSDYALKPCLGCKLCFTKGEEFCPLKDDRDVLMEKIMASDGVVFASPNYSFQVSAIMKLFLDRFGYAFHRPCYFGKAFTSIVSQGFAGGDKIVKYLDLIGSGLGFNTAKGTCVPGIEPLTEKDQRKTSRAVEELSKRFYTVLANPAYPVPTLFKLMIFRMGRSTVKRLLDDNSRDYTYYADKGWLESDYFYPTRLGVLKKVAGNLFDSMSETVRDML